MKLRPEQSDIIEECMASVMFGSKNIILDLHTSFGKSLIMSELAKRLDGKVVIMVNITPLIDQIAEHLDEIGLEYSILKAGYEDRFDDTKRVQLVMSQTFYARMEKVTIHADYFLQDEVHREYDTDRTMALLRHLDNPIRIGLTGTSMDSEGYALEDSETLVGSSIKNSEKLGYIVPLKYYVPQWSEKVDYDKVAASGNDYSSVSLDEIINTDAHTKAVVESMNKMKAKDKKTLVFCNSIEHCETVTQALKDAGYSAESIHSKKDSKTNERILSAYSSNSPINQRDDHLFSEEGDYKPEYIKCLLSVSKLNVGFSVNDIELGVMLRPTKVRSLWIQSCGRLIRKADDKKYAEMLDLAGCITQHGFHSEPYQAPTKGDRVSLAKEKDRVAQPVIKLIANEEQTHITDRKIKVKVEELEQAKKDLENEQDISRLNYLFEAADNPYDVIRIAGIIGNRFRGLPHMSEANIRFVSDEWDKMIEFNLNYKNRIIKTLKTMSRNKVKDKKKLVALKYTPEWLYSVNGEYRNHLEPEIEYEVPVIEVDDEDIPF